MSLYLANPSKQFHKFYYREPVNGHMSNVELASGQQAEIGHGWTAEQTARVIEQLERFGGRDAAEAHGRMAKFSGLIYRDNGQIETNEIEMAHEAEEETRGQRSAAAATAGALGFDRVVRSGARDRPPARVTETEVVQDVAPGEKRRRGQPGGVNFSLTVDPETGRSDVNLPLPA